MQCAIVQLRMVMWIGDTCQLHAYSIVSFVLTAGTASSW